MLHGLSGLLHLTTVQKQMNESTISPLTYIAVSYISFTAYPYWRFVTSFWHDGQHLKVGTIIHMVLQSILGEAGTLHVHSCFPLDALCLQVRFFFFLERKSVCKEVFLGKWLFVYWKIRVRRICALLDTYLSQRISQCSKTVWTPTCMREIFLLNPLTYLGSINNLGKWNFTSLIWNNFTNMNPYIEQPQT